MRKIFLMMLLTLAIKGFGQTYSVNVSYDASAAACHAAQFSWELHGNSTLLIDSFSAAGNSMNVSGTKIHSNVPNYSSLTLSTSSSCVGQGHNPDTCDLRYTQMLTRSELIKGGMISLGGCNGGVEISSFKPNVTISKGSNPVNSTVCAGEELNLNAFPAGFPNEAYHWQYSFDGTSNWIDMPQTKNDTPQTRFSIQEILGSAHEQYFNTQIYFRLGYGQGRPFTAPLAITYSPCAPVITAINYVGPKCNGDSIQKIEVFFDRPLASNEVLNPIYIQRSLNGPISDQRYNVVFDADNPLRYTFTNISRLESGHTYNIAYQTERDGLPIGTLRSTQSFTYNEIAPLTFTKTTTNITCNGANNGTITVTYPQGGNGTYQYSKDNGATWQISPTFSGLANGTYQIAVKDHLGCTTTSQEVVLTEPAPITISGTVTNETGPNRNDGSIIYSIGGGNSGYTENWFKDGTPFTASTTALGKGTYRIIVSDALGCTAEHTFVVKENITCNATVENVKCIGDSDGSITLDIRGGSGNYNILWNDGVQTKDRSGLIAARYSYTITDALGDSTVSLPTTSLTVSEPNTAFTIRLNSKRQPSPNSSNGIIDMSVSGGYGTYSYIWTKNGATFSPASSADYLTGLENGTYQLTVTDKNGTNDTGTGCTLVSDPIVLKALTIDSADLVNIKCKGDSTGSIAINTSGGTLNANSSYTYTWFKNGAEITGENSSTLTMVSAGNYTAEVSDDDFNVALSPIYTLTEPSAVLTVISSPLQQHPVSCNGGSDGAIEISVSGGTGGYTFLWSNNSTNQNQINLSAGTYSVRVTDANNCESNLQHIEIQEPDPVLIPEPIITAVTIYGQNTGAITLTEPTGGNGTYSYKWTSTTDPAFVPKNTKDISNLKAGFYAVEVRDHKSNTADNAGCISTRTFEVKQSPELIVAINESKSIQCNGDSTGELTATVNGGVPGYTYQWYKNELPILGDLVTQTGLGTGNYKVRVRDSKGAEKTTLVYSLRQPELLTVSVAAQTNVLCYGAATGSIDIIIAGGSAPYDVLWQKEGTDYAQSEDLTLLPSGNYDVLITDSHGCGAILPNAVHITQPDAPLLITDLEVKNLTGFETQNGSISVAVSGGTAPYIYNWRNKGVPVIIGSTSIIDKLPIGVYELTVTDNNNCHVIKEYTLTQPDKLIIQSITQNPDSAIQCYGDKTAELTAIVIGGVPDYIYKWYNVLDPTAILSTTKTVPNLGAGKYIVAVIDQENNILYGTNEYTITQPNPLAISNIKTEVSCKGGNDGTISLSITGGSSDYSIIWNYDSVNNNGKTNITGLPAGTYTVMVSDKNAVNCSISKTITITEPTDDLVIASDTVQNASGFGLSNGKIIVQIFGGTPAYTYKWFKNNVEITGETIAVLDNQLAGSYKLIVTDSKNCTVEKPFTITEPLELKVTIAIAKTIDCFDATGILRAQATVGTGVPNAQGFYTYKWYRENGTLINTTLDSEARTGNIPKGKYYVTVIDSNNNQTTSPLFEITQPTQIIVTTVHRQDVTCYDGFDGIVEINVVGGTPDIVAGAPVYTYLWSNGSTTKNQYSLRKGNYSVTVYDGNLCIGSLTNIIIDQPEDFGFDLDKIVPTIPTSGNNDGALHIEIVGGIAPYRYLCKDSNGTIIKEVANSTLKQVDFTNLASSIFTVSATDATGCTKSTEFDFNNNVLEINITQSAEITCNNGKNASVIAVVNGGFGIRTISWFKNGTKIPNESSALLNNLEIGTYYVIVKDFNKVEVTSKSIVITQPDPIVVANTQKNASCLGYNDGTITLTAAGGSNRFQYRFKSQDSGYGNWIAFDNLTTVIPNLKANTYDIQVQDSKGCNYTSIVNVEITEPKQLLISQNIITPATGFGLSNGSINITVQGGTAAYNYKWFTNANVQVTGTTATASNLAAGKYYAVVTDAKGCSVTTELYEVKQPALLVVKITPVNAVLCNGDKNASLRANASGGLPGYTYKWFSVPDTGVLGTNITLGNLGIGTYYVEVTDTKNNVSKSNLFTINEPQKVDNTLSADYTLCGDGKDWTITPAPTGGTKPYHYLWNTGATTEILKNATPGNYSVTVTDFNGCNITKSISFIAPPHLDTSETIKMPTCYLGSDAKIVVTPIAGTAPYTYLWNTGEKTNILNNASAGKYSIEITDFRGCKITRNYTIVDPPKDVIYLGEDVTLCYEQSLTINASIDDDKATYLWTSDKGFKSTNPIITVSQPANYTVVVTNKLGCQATDTITISSQDSAISSEFAMSSQVFVNEKFIIVDISNPKADKITWKLPPEAVVTTNNGDYAEMSFSQTGEYELILITQKGNCTATQTKKILIVEGEYERPEDIVVQKRFDLKIYPNPSNGIFSVDIILDKIMPASVKVFNLSNNQIIDSKLGQASDNYSFQFSLNGLPAGIYFILFESQQGSQLRKIIIQ